MAAFRGEKNKKNYLDNPDQLNTIVSCTKITGDIVTDSSFRVDGKIEGNINSKGKVVLGETGEVTGNIVAIEVEIKGIVNGHIKAIEILTLHNTAKIVGNIISRRLIIDEGAIFDGNIKVLGDKAKENNNEKDKPDFLRDRIQESGAKLIY